MPNHPDPRHNPWTTRSTEVRYANPWIQVEHHDVLTPGGRPGIYGVVRFRNLAVGAVPVDGDGCTWLVGQFRYPHDRYSWEIPEGGAAKQEAPEAAVRRELLEETGLRARGLLEIARVDLSNSVSDESGILYVAWDLSQEAPQPEDTEQLAVRRLPLAEVFRMVMDGRITDSLSVIALLKLRVLASEPTLPADLSEALRKGFGQG